MAGCPTTYALVGAVPAPPNESLQLTERRMGPLRQPSSSPAAPQLNSSVAGYDHPRNTPHLACALDAPQSRQPARRVRPGHVRRPLERSAWAVPPTSGLGARPRGAASDPTACAGGRV